MNTQIQNLTGDLKRKLNLTFLFLFLACVSYGQTQEISANQQDYYPGDVVVLTGAGWMPGETVEIVLVHSIANHPNDMLYSVADSSGSFVNTDYTVQWQELGEYYICTATGQTSTLSATIYFTDSPRIGAVSFSPSSQTICVPASGTTSVSYTITATRTQNGTVNGTYSVGTLPSGVTLSSITGATFTAGGSSLFPSATVNLTVSSAASAGSFSIPATCADGSDQGTGSGTLVLSKAPSFTSCPSNTSANAAAGVCTAVVSYTATTTGTPSPTLAYSFSGATTGSGSGTGSGSTFNKGVTTINITASNSCSPNATCSFTITVNDNQNPTISCVANQTRSTNTGVCTYTSSGIEFNPSSFSDNCTSSTISYTLSGVTTGSGSSLAGVVFNKGVTAVSWKVTDASANSATCSFNVTVNDNENPAISCVTNQTRNTASGVCTYTVSGTEFNATSSDNCGASTLAYSLNGVTTGTGTSLAGVIFNKGITTVTWTATDATSNSATCSFTVTVVDIYSPTITCLMSQSRSTNSGLCTYTVSGTEFNPTVSSDNCGAPTLTYTLTGITSGSGSSLAGVVFNRGVTFVKWTAIDATANSATCSFVVAVNDNENPVVNCAANQSRNADPGVCTYTAMGTEFTPAASDNCGTVTIAYSLSGMTSGTGSSLQGVAFNGGLTTVTWTATDAVANSTTCSFTVTVSDNQNPVITCPADITAGCDDLFTISHTGNVSATDNCTLAPAITHSDLNSQDSNPANSGHYNYSITRTFTATDESGNSSTCVQLITVQDVTAPTISSCPSAATVNCQDATDISALGNASASDNCSAVAVSHADVSAQNADASLAAHYNYTITRTFTATDVTGNFSTCVQLITVQDVTAPTISSCPSAATVNCQDATDISALGNASASDNCSAVAVSHADVSAQNADASLAAHYNYTITRTFTATDVTGNFSTCVQLITVQDVTAPTISSCPSAATVNCQDATDISALGNASASDNCSAVAVSHADVSAQNADASLAAHYNYTITRTFTATDVTGNFSTCVQLITVQDVTAPTISSCPSAVTVNCQDATSIAELGNAAASDNCSAVAVSHADVSTQDADASLAAHYNYTITRTFTATDVTGNFSTCVQLITVQDVTAPSITNCPVAATVNCQDATSIAELGNASASDNCSAVAISHADVSTQDADASAIAHYNYTIARTFTATDVTGNFSTCVQLITVQDVTAPSITNCPVAATVNCQDATDISALGNASASDNCSAVAVSHADVSAQNADASLAAHYNYTITRTFTATDVTGNFSTCVQLITVQDVTAPTISSCPSAVTVNCQDATSIAELGNAAASDTCSAVAVSHADVSAQNADASLAAHYNYTITRTFTATDVTGNFSTCVQLITVQDVTAPTISSCPSAATVNCQDATSIAELGNAAASDNCSAVAVSHADVSTQDADASLAAHYNYTITRTFTATDVTGNFSTCVQLITVQDVTAPSITNCPVAATVNCQDATSIAELGNASASDNCSAVAISHADVSTQDADASLAAHYNYTITRTFTATDVTGNFSTCVQLITVQDVTAPSITNCPVAATVNCQDATSIAELGNASASDNCSAVAISHADVSTQDADASAIAHYNYTIARTFTATDVTGNFSTCVQLITVQDVTAPTFTRPANITIYTTSSCTYNATPAVTGDVTNEADNCSTGLNATYTDVVANGSCEGTHIISRTWHLSDISGNAAANQIQTITVLDNIAPTFTRPANITIYTTSSCTYNATTAVTGDVTNEADNCSIGLNATYSDAIANGACQGTKIITRTWSLVDNCGNAAANQVQTITVLDNIAPTFTRPANITIYTTSSCTYNATTAVTGDVTNEADNCSIGLNATYSDAIANGACQGTKIITRTWSLVDNCGNAAANQVQTITVLDNIAPTFTRPVNITIYTTSNCTYNASPSITGDVTNEADNCSTGLNATYSDVTVPGPYFGAQDITRTWSLVDNCGNAAANQVQTILVRDNIAPVITCPANITVNYNASQCGAVVNYSVTATDNCTYTIARIQGPASGSTFALGTTTVSHTATDAAGNSVGCSFTVTVIPAVTTSSVTISTNIAQYSDKITYTATITGGASLCSGPNAAATVTFKIGTQTMGTVSMVPSGANLVGILSNSPLLEPTPFGTLPTGQLSPGVKTVMATFNSINPNFTVPNNPTTTLTLNKEHARATYTGTPIQATASSSTTTAAVVLSANIMDIAVPQSPADPNFDGDGGDIRNAKVKFVNRDNNTDISGWIPVTTLVSPLDTKIGTVSYSWTVNLGSATDIETTVGIVVDNGYYYRDNQDDNTVVTVYKPVGDFITGGGYIVPTASNGTYASDAGRKTNFGFNVKYNNKGTNLQGNMNFIFRKLQNDNIVHVYQIKANSMISLGVNITNANAKTSNYVAKANLKDITDPLAPVSLGGNLGFYVTMVDRGEPGSSDSISVALTSSYGLSPTVLTNLLYTSNWVSSMTKQMGLTSGNLDVHSGFSLRVDNYQPQAEETLSEGMLSQNYPNPFSGKTTIAFSVPNGGHTTLEVYNSLGQLVNTLFNDNAEAGITYKVEFDTDNSLSGIYFYTLRGEGVSETKKMQLIK